MFYFLATVEILEVIVMFFLTFRTYYDIIYKEESIWQFFFVNDVVDAFLEYAYSICNAKRETIKLL